MAADTVSPAQPVAGHLSSPETAGEAAGPATNGGGTWRRLLLGLLRLLAGRRARKQTRAERREEDGRRLARAQAKSREAGLQLEAEQNARNLSERLADLGVCYEYRKKDGSGWARYKLVRFMRPYVLRDEAIYLKVDLRPGKAPRGVGVAELSDPKIIENLALAVGHPVFCRYTPERGFWYIIERELGKRGIPAHVKFDDMLAQRPGHIDGLSVPLGVGADKRIQWRSFSKMLSMLIAGSPNGGKSNAVNAMLCALIKFNSPSKLRLLLVDLKGGVEFSFYAGLPHLLAVPVDDVGTTAGIVERREEVIPALKWLIGEGERRLEILKAGHYKKIGEYNFDHRARPMPHIVVVIDEWADVKAEPKLGAQAEELLINISNRFRAAGLHLILSTQSPTKEVVSLRVKNALASKLVFNCANQYASMVIIGNYDAYKLEPVGRAIFENGDLRLPLQTPFINNEQVENTVAQAIRGEFEEAQAKAHDVTDGEIYDWAVSENRGYIPAAAVYDRYRKRGMTKEYAESFCKRSEGLTVMVGTTTYQILPGGGPLPRRLISTDQLEEESRPQAEPGPAVAEAELLAWALAENAGRLGARALYDEFRARGLSRPWVEAFCKQAEGKVYTVAGRAYRVLPSVRQPGKGTLPRRLAALDDAQPGAQPEPAAQPAEPEPTAGPDPGPDNPQDLAGPAAPAAGAGDLQTAIPAQTIPNLTASAA